MNKIPTLFERDWDGDRSRVVNVVTRGCEWVLAGEGVATQKLDGTCCLVRGGRLYKRHEVKPGKAAPDYFEAVSTDEETGKIVGWVPVGEGPEDKWHHEALARHEGTELPAGTYELLGPKIQGNPELQEHHVLIRHADVRVWPDAPRDFDGLAAWLAEPHGIGGIEGLVWHHPDGRMAKIKLRDFGIRRA